MRVGMKRKRDKTKRAYDNSALFAGVSEIAGEAGRMVHFAP